MKFSLHHIVWAFVVCAVWCGVVAYSIDRERDREREAEQQGFEHVDGPAQNPLVHGKQIVETFTARVIGLTDGDTIKVLNDSNEQIKVRLDCIDCPELDQPHGKKAKQATSELVFGRTVEILSTGNDRYGRVLAFVVVDGVDVCEDLVEVPHKTSPARRDAA